MNNNNNRQRQIEQLSRELTALSQRLEQLIIAEAEAVADNDNNFDQTQRAVQAVAVRDRDFVIGDQVEITNNYRDQRGLRGTIVTVTPQTVSLRLHGQNRVLTKRKENVRRIHVGEQ